MTWSASPTRWLWLLGFGQAIGATGCTGDTTTILIIKWVRGIDREHSRDSGDVWCYSVDVTAVVEVAADVTPVVVVADPSDRVGVVCGATGDVFDEMMRSGHDDVEVASL